MRKIGRELMLLAVVVFVMLTFPATLFASSGDGDGTGLLPDSEGPAVYVVSTREQSGGKENSAGPESEWRYDYIALNDDGTGVFMYNMTAFTIRWTWDDDSFSFVDHKGNEFAGSFDASAEEAKITGVYGKYRYEFVHGDWELPVYTISPQQWGNGLGGVTDQASVLSSSQMEAYTKKAQELTDQYDVGVHVVLLDERDDFTWTKNIESLGEEIRAGYQIGIGSTEKKKAHEGNPGQDWKDSILLTVVFDQRNYDICVSGNYADWAFNQYGREKIRDSFVDDFKENRWADGIGDYLDSVGEVLATASRGHAMSFRYDTAGRMISIFAPILLALLFGYGIAAVMRASMQNTQRAQNAAAYVAGDQVNFKRREDRYIRTVVSRVYSPREKSSGSGGGGHSSSGSSHTSGSF